MNNMPIDEIIERVTDICKSNNVEHLKLFGSFATSTYTPTNDVDFVFYGCKDLLKLEYEIEQIDTLRKIDIFNYEDIHNEYLLEDIKLYGKHIY